MPWSQFFTIIAQFLIAFAVVGVASAVIVGMVRGARGQR